jgi:hypothetical protein
MAFNGAIIGLMVLWLNSGFDCINQRFDDTRDLWRVEVRRVGEVLDARLKHLEQL